MNQALGSSPEAGCSDAPSSKIATRGQKAAAPAGRLLTAPSLPAYDWFFLKQAVCHLGDSRSNVIAKNIFLLELGILGVGRTGQGVLQPLSSALAFPGHSSRYGRALEKTPSPLTREWGFSGKSIFSVCAGWRNKIPYVFAGNPSAFLLFYFCKKLFFVNIFRKYLLTSKRKISPRA